GTAAEELAAVLLFLKLRAKSRLTLRHGPARPSHPAAAIAVSPHEPSGSSLAWRSRGALGARERALEEDGAVRGAELLFERAVGVRHHAQHVAAGVDDARDVARRAVRIVEI